MFNPLQAPVNVVDEPVYSAAASSSAAPLAPAPAEATSVTSSPVKSPPRKVVRGDGTLRRWVKKQG